MALKIPPLVLLVLLSISMWMASRWTPELSLEIPGKEIIAAGLALVGLAVCALGVVSFRAAKTTVDPLSPASASSLVVAGIYRYSRNPMYAGFALILLGWGVFLSSLLALLAVPLFVLYINRYQIEPEERALEALFGEDYLAYKRSVRRWL